ncbi:MAG: hypothetical protein COT90_02560 [Candidatus Diapherotrites archaeon CG10_big_fil_rev_8_21_14_0_10_31_34]|nr:MAG: hypothetical protein COT90_02560 [Candidatus Diapherotrites archaeon CG10_big_fil_rev_8_21_14_0_10_31_34]
MKEKNYWKEYLMNELIFDSSSIISIAQNCLMKVLENLSKKTKNQFVMTKGVEFESVLKPLTINKFELNALRIKRSIDLGWFKVEKNEVNSEKIEELANNIFFAENTPIKIIHKGEAEALALYKKLNASVLVIDERTTRMLIEEPKNLEKKLKFHYRKKIKLNKANLKKFSSFVGKVNIVRSAELITKAFDLGCFEGELDSSKKSLEASLFALKFNGCAVSIEEINDYLSAVK